MLRGQVSSIHKINLMVIFTLATEVNEEVDVEQVQNMMEKDLAITEVIVMKIIILRLVFLDMSVT